MSTIDRLTIGAVLATILGIAGCDKTLVEVQADRNKEVLARVAQVTWIGTFRNAKAELTFGASSTDALKATLVFLELDEPTVEESLEGHISVSSGFELHGTAVKSLVGGSAPELHIIELGLLADGALAGYAHTATTKDYPVHVKFKPGTSATTLPSIDVARATSRLLEFRWEGKLEGAKPLSLDTRREGAKLAGVLTHSENPAEGFIYVTRTGKFSFQTPASPGGGAVNTVSCQGSIAGAFDALKGECEFKASKGFQSQGTTLAFSLRPTTSPAPAPTASASTTATANTHAPPPPAASTRKPR